MSTFEIYLLLKLDSIGLFCCVMSFVFTVLMVISVALLIGCSNKQDESEKLCFKITKVTSVLSTILAVLFFIFVILIPTTKQACAIYLIPKIINNEQIQNIGKNGLSIVESKFQEWIDDTIKTTKLDVEK